jgi:two-component system OmpR family sensor kinase
VSIRARLTVAVVVLVVVATGAIGWVVVGAARTSMVDRLDDGLVEAVDRSFSGPGPFNRRPDDQRSIAEVIVDGDGTVLRASPAGFGDDPDPLPDLPTDAAGLEALAGRITTRDSVGGGADQRVLVASLQPVYDGYRIVATSLADVDATTSRLWGVFGVALVAVGAAGAALAWWVVRIGLRPVDSMIETAGAIAAGDMSARVDHPDDGTELGRLGAALDEMLARLEAAFDERTASETRLKRFAADASHELRTPITAVRGYAELYRRGGLTDPDDLARAMARVESEATRMGRLVEDLLLLARLDQQRPMEVRPVDLRTVVDDAAADHRALGDSHPLTVDAPDPVVVSGDESGLRQVVANLLANARVHTPAGTPVAVTLRAEGDAAVLTVSDQGPGIPAAQLDRVFERFHRGDPSRSRATGGAGLGLAIASALVAAHGGTLSAAGGDPGATFTVRLPRP